MHDRMKDAPVLVVFLEKLRVLVVAGVLTGALVAGLGGRLAMLVLRLTSPEGVRGVISDDGFRIGEVTLFGTYSLVALGAAIGIIGAAAYRWVCPWLLGPPWFRRVTVSAGSAVVVGSMLIHADGVDFTLLQPTWLAIALFLALPAAFGWLIGWAVDRVAAPTSWTARGRRRWVVPVVLVACFPVVIILVGVTALMLAIWVPIRAQPQTLRWSRSWPVLLVARAAWLAVAVAGLAALLGDIEALA